MVKKYEYQGHTFEIDDSNSCVAEFSLGKYKAFVGPSLYSGPNKPYVVFFPQVEPDVRIVEPNGINRAGNQNSVRDAINGVCGTIPSLKDRDEWHVARTPESDCKALHEFVAGLPDA